MFLPKEVCRLVLDKQKVEIAVLLRLQLFIFEFSMKNPS